MIFENNDFGVGGNVNFFTEANLYSWIQKSPLLTRKLSSKYLHSNKVGIRNAFWDLNKYMTKNCPSWKSREQPPEHPPPTHPPKIEIFLSQILIIRDIQNLPLYICFWGWQKGWNIKEMYVSPKLSKSKMAANYGHIIVLSIKSINMPFLDIALIASKQTGFRSNEC